MTPQPRRRDADQERRRWNDHSLDLLEGRVETVEDQASALSRLPERVADNTRAIADQGQAVRDLGAAQIRAAELEERRVRGLHRDVKELRRELLGRFDKVDRDHATIAAGGQPATPRPDWKTVLAAVSALTVPLAAAIIAASN